jgi:hypothetical protein
VKTLRQATLRRRSAFYVLLQGHEPEEEFVDPASARHDETLADLLRRPTRSARAHDPNQLDLW